MAPGELGLEAAQVPQDLHPVLADFYRRFGTLAETQSKYRPEGANHPLGTQDRILPLSEVKVEGDHWVFGVENQGVFVVAAACDPTDLVAHARGDMVETDDPEEMNRVGVSLVDCLVCSVLRETIMSVGDRYRRLTPKIVDAALAEARKGETFELAYLWPEAKLTFHLSNDVWAMEWDGMKFFARRGLWRKPPQTWQEQVFEGGGGWSSGPANPTLLQRLQRFFS